MKTLTLLKLNEISPSGHMYCFDSIKHLLDTDNPDPVESCGFRQSAFHGETESPDVTGGGLTNREAIRRLTSIDMSSACLTIKNLRYDAETQSIIGDVEPFGSQKDAAMSSNIEAVPRLIHRANNITGVLDGQKYRETKVQSFIAFDLKP